MKSITRWLAALAVICQPFMLTSCHDDDLANGIIDEGGDSEGSVIPTEDKIETYLDGDIALIGNKFDEATSYILSRVRGQKINLSLGSSSVPATARVLLIDDENMMNLTADDIDRLIVPAYKQGTIICMHKPSDWKAAGVQMALWQVEHGTDGVDVAENALASAAKSRKTRATDDGTSYEDSSSDFIAIKPGGMDFSMADIYTPNTTSQAVMQITTQEDDGEIMTKDSIVTVPSEEPTDYEYGRFAEEAVKWMNETEEEAKSKAMRAVLSTRNEGDNINVSQVCNSQRTVSCTFWNRHGNPNGDGAFVKQDYNRNVPLKIRVYTSSAYNFDLDEDYYHVVMEEEFDASKLYHGRFEMKEKDMRIAGYTWQGMEVQARWNNSDYAVRDEWNIQPQGRAQPVVTETVNGWEIGANVSLGKDGVSGKLSGKLTYKEGVTSTESDVELTNTRQEDWMVWNYRMGNQVSFTGSKGKVNGPNVPTNATSRSLSSRRQSWDWVIKGTRRRADNPFTFDFKVQEMTGQVAWADIYPVHPTFRVIRQSCRAYSLSSK